MKYSLSLFVLVITSILLCGSLAAAINTTPEQEAIAEEIFVEILSPFCPGRSLNDCPSASASELKEEIRDRLAHGEGRLKIVNSLYKRYGNQIRAVPPGEGFGLLAWAMPLIFALGGGIFLFGWFLSQRNQFKQKPLDKTPAPQPADHEMRERIEQELREI